jgi:hypothetical protein
MESHRYRARTPFHADLGLRNLSFDLSGSLSFLSKPLFGFFGIESKEAKEETVFVLGSSKSVAGSEGSRFE